MATVVPHEPLLLPTRDPEEQNKNMGKQRRRSVAKKLRRPRNPVAAVDERLQPFPHVRPVASVPGVAAVSERARLPYRKNPISEDEALNLICDARSGEPTYPLRKLLKKFASNL